MIEALQSLEWITWGYVVAIIGLLVLLEAVIIQYIRG
jgi:hypothetical protein